METLATKEKLMRTAAVVTMAALGALGLVGCGATIDRAKTVVVEHHEYDDPDTWITFIKSGKTWVPITNHDPEHFLLDVKQCGYKAKDAGVDDDGCIRSVEEVDQQKYKEIKDGDEILLSQIQ